MFVKIYKMFTTIIVAVKYINIKIRQIKYPHQLPLFIDSIFTYSSNIYMSSCLSV